MKKVTVQVCKIRIVGASNNVDAIWAAATWCNENGYIYCDVLEISEDDTASTWTANVILNERYSNDSQEKY